MNLEIQGLEKRCYKSKFGGFHVDGESIGELIAKKLPKGMKDSRDYWVDIKIELELHGVEEAELNVNADYEIPKDTEVKEDNAF